MRLATIVLIFVALGACSGGKSGSSNNMAEADTFNQGPSGADVNNAVLQSANSFFGRISPNISLSASAKKLDGQPTTVAGADGYRDFVAVEITFPNGLRPECTRPGPLCITYAGPPPTRYKTVVSYRGTIEASKSERGWIIDSVNIDYSKPTNTVVDAPPLPNYSALDGHWTWLWHDDSTCYNPWHKNTAAINFPQGEISGMVEADPIIEGKVDEDRLSFRMSNIQYSGQINKEAKTLSGSFSGMNVHGTFFASRSDNLIGPNLCTGDGQLRTPQIGERDKSLKAVDVLNGSVPVRCFGAYTHLEDDTIRAVQSAKTIDAARAILEGRNIRLDREKATVSSQISDELRSRLSAAPIGKPIIVANPGAFSVCSLYS